MKGTPLLLVILAAFIAALNTYRVSELSGYTAFEVIGCVLLWAFFAVHLIRYIKQKRNK